MSRLRFLCGCLIAGGWSALAAAQATVTGVARDSRTGLPFVGAVVELVPAATPWATALRTQTDSSGRYAVLNVPPANYLVGFMHPALEDVGLSQVTRRIEVPPTERRVAVDLTPPTGAELVSLVCGPEAASRGALLGRVLAADTSRQVHGGMVTVQWEQLNIALSGVSSGPVLRSTPLLADGRYLVCDLPTDARILVRASGADSAGTSLGSSGVVELEFAYGTPILHRDLLIAAAAPDVSAASATVPAVSARVSGRIISDAGRPVANAQVSLPDAATSVRTDASGNFRLSGLPSGTHMLDVIAIGYTPARLLVDLQPGRETVQSITMSRGAQTLDEVTINVRMGKTGFERRREQGIGHFVSADEIERRGLQTLPMVLSAIPTLRMTGVEQNGSPIISGRGGCTPSYFVDGQPILASAITFGTIRDIGGVEVYGSASEAPPQFAGPSRAMRLGPAAEPDSSSRPRNPFTSTGPAVKLDAYGRDLGSLNQNALCAVILIWTKAYVR